MYQRLVTRYSVLEKPGFKVLKVNFLKKCIAGFELIRSHLDLDGADYVRSLLPWIYRPPED